MYGTIRHAFNYTLLVCTLLTVSACGSSQHEPTTSALLPMHSEPTDPEDEILVAAVRHFLENTEAPVASRYEFERVDLNNDGRREGLVLFETPYGYWCGTHGCTMLVFEAHNDGFSLVNDIQPVREPLFVSYEESNGWKSIVHRVAGRQSRAKYVSMEYDGRHYPSDPSRLPPSVYAGRAAYQPIFYN
ncbi:MAG: hypothetical protein JKY71_11130 [Alphaproteobacteria bacterium]|nr:hypothetical protein [Alphaproteobacteria bacterium]